MTNTVDKTLVQVSVNEARRLLGFASFNANKGKVLAAQRLFEKADAALEQLLVAIEERDEGVPSN